MPVLVALLVLGVTPASAGAAKRWKFKADVFIQQTVEWQSGWKSPYICGRGFRYTYKGSGEGGFVVKQNGIPVTFRARRGYMETGDFAIRNQSMLRRSSYVTGSEGDPKGCPPGTDLRPTPPDTSKCGSYRYKTRDKAFSLLVIGGRLGPLGSIDDPTDAKCPDETSWSVVTKGAASKQRRDVDDLIRRKSVRSIRLSSDDGWFNPRTERGFLSQDLTAEDVFLPGDQDTVTASGTAGYRWKVRLRRVK